MSVNTMSFEQAAAILTSLTAQMTGERNLAVQNLSDYISVGQKALRTGYDPLSLGISQMVSKTIFAYRPYTGALSILDRDNIEWGAITRKVNAIQQDVENSDVYALTDNTSPDMFAVKKPKLYQTNFYGFDVWSDHVSVTRQQLKNAVSNPSDMGRLLDLILGTKANEMELSREAFRRATLANMIGALNAIGNSAQVRHLLTEYNAATGLSLTATTVKQPANYAGFIRWAYAEIAKVSDKMTSMNAAFHLNPTEGTILRHTPKEMQRLFVFSGALHEVDANVLATTFNASRVADQLPPVTASVDFFQSFNTPDSVNVTPAYIGADGAVATATAQEVTNIFALLADRDALGVNFYDQSVDVSPYNARGKFYNYWYSDAHRYYNDVTENAVLFLMD
jgi:hypothetical protein